MNLPNKLTLLRVALIPVTLIFLYQPAGPYTLFFALLSFVAASLTDLLDGKLARSMGLITDFGKLMDPLADKLLVLSVLVALAGEGIVPSVAVVVILARELAVTSLRLVAAGKGHVLAADGYGKWKTTFQMTWIIYLLVYRWFLMLPLPLPMELFALWGGRLEFALMLIAVFLTILSGANYFVRNREIFMNEL